MRNRVSPYFGDFKCIYCNYHISTDTFLSGVKNRNHCPYCLHSRHVDLHEAGDRLSACKADMEPIGLSLKHSNKKYGSGKGELMIIHRCTDCGKLSINRIAADDIPDHIFAVYTRSLKLDQPTRRAIQGDHITLLSRDDEEIVRARLYGWGKNSLVDANLVYPDYSAA